MKHKEYVKVVRGSKTFYQLREVGSDKPISEDVNEVMNYLETMANGNWTPKQKAFFEFQFKNAKPVVMTHTDRFPKSWGIAKGRPQIKQCYSNAVKCSLYSHGELPVYYVEGFINVHGLPIEHAWNKIGNDYFDITAEGPLKTTLSDTSYISIIEVDPVELSKLLLETEQYGPFMGIKFAQSLKSE